MIANTVEGNPASRVRLEIYEDLQCRDCAWLRRKLDETLLPKYADRAAFEHREFPIPRHDWARQAAIAALHLGRLGLGIDFRREILESISQIPLSAFEAFVRAFARRNKVDEDAAAAALSDAELAAAVDRDYQDGIARGVAKTPTIFLGDRIFIERINLEDLMDAIDAELAR